MRKIYENPSILVQEFITENVITTSGTGTENTFKSRMADTAGISEGSVKSTSASSFKFDF